jgi:hypothetical protein
MSGDGGILSGLLPPVGDLSRWARDCCLTWDRPTA